MKKGLIALIVVGAVLLTVILAVVGGYNGLVDKQEAVNTAQSQISNQLQRRADLIPNFVNTVKGYADYEKSTYTAVTEARAAVSKANTITEQQEASEQLDKAVSIWVNAITEAYPDLKAVEQFTALTDELSGTENRIAVARKDYNDAAKSYNTAIRKFPKNIIASLFGFEKADYFEAAEGTDKVPEVSFS